MRELAFRSAFAFAIPLLALHACVVERYEASSMPVVRVQTTKGLELGVSTDDGIVFLGRTAKKGPAKLIYYLGPSPMVEAGEITPLGASFHEVQTELALPSVPISMDPLQPGEDLLVMGLDGYDVWSYWTEASSNDQVSGTVLDWPSGFDPKPAHVGAGVFRQVEGVLWMVGLLKGTLRLSNGERYLLIAGLPEMRRAFLEPRSATARREVKYRADGVRVVRWKR